MDAEDDAFAARGERRVEQAKRVTEVAVIADRRRSRRCHGKAVGGVVMGDDDDVAVGIIAADVAPVDGAAAHDERKDRRERAAYGMLTHGADRHLDGLYLLVNEGGEQKESYGVRGAECGQWRVRRDDAQRAFTQVRHAKPKVIEVKVS